MKQKVRSFSRENDGDGSYFGGENFVFAAFGAPKCHLTFLSNAFRVSFVRLAL